MKQGGQMEKQQNEEANVLAAQRGHRTIRRFTHEPVAPSQVAQIREVADRTATALGLQMASVIRVTDDALRNTFGEVTGQPYVAEAPELWVFLADVHRNATIVEKETGQKPTMGMGKFLSAYADALLMAQNVMNAVEALHLGGAFIGSIANDLMRIREALHLPTGTYPAIAVIFGHPEETPQQKPRMPKTMRFFENTYPVENPDEAALAHYDTEMQTYTDLRHPEHPISPFTQQVIRSFSDSADGRDALLLFLSQAGFSVSAADE